MMLTKEQKSVKNGLKQKKHSADQELSIVVDFGWKVVDNDIFPMFWSGSAIGVNDELRES